jgi:hypothetical protein
VVTDTRLRAWLSGTLAIDLSSASPDALLWLRTVRTELTLWKRGFGALTEGGETPFWFEEAGWLHLPKGYLLTGGSRWLNASTTALYERRSDGVPLPPGTRVRGVSWGAPPFPPGQAAFIESIAAGARANGYGGLAVAPTRSGKTLCSLDAACLLGGSTLVLVDRGGLEVQWRGAIENFVRDDRGRPVRVGHFREDRAEFDTPFCVGMLQTLARRSLSEEQRRAFRTVILDECSVAPASTAWEGLRRFEARYVLGLTASPKRADGLAYAIPWIVGPPIAHLERRLEGEVWFRHVPYDAETLVLDGEGRERKPRLTVFGNYNRVEAERALAAQPAYLNDVVAQATAAARAGRQVLIFAGLVDDHLAKYVPLLKAQGLNPGWYAGDAPKSEMVKNPVLTSYAKSEKGEDFLPAPTLVILAAPPPGDPTQAIGRGLQPQAPAKPIILHYVAAEPTFVKQAAKCLKVYRGLERLGLEVKTNLYGRAA